MDSHWCRMAGCPEEKKIDALLAECERLTARIREFDKSIDAEMRDPNGTIWEVANAFLARAEKSEARVKELELGRDAANNKAAQWESIAGDRAKEAFDVRGELAQVKEELDLCCDAKAMKALRDELAAEKEKSSDLFVQNTRQDTTIHLLEADLKAERERNKEISLCCERREKAEQTAAELTQKNILLEGLNRQAESRIGFLENETREQFAKLAYIGTVCGKVREALALTEHQQKGEGKDADR